MTVVTVYAYGKVDQGGGLHDQGQHYEPKRFFIINTANILPGLIPAVIYNYDLSTDNALSVFSRGRV